MTHQANSGTGATGTLPDELLDELDATVAQLGRLFSARHGEACCEGALSMAQMMALRGIHEHGSVKVGELAAFLGIKAPAASALVEALERTGLLEREADPADRRVSRVRLTAAGDRRLAEAEADRRHHMRRYASVLTHEDISNLIRINRKLIDALLSERG